MTAATLALVGGVVLWQTRTTTHTAVPATRSTVNDAGVPMGGVAERLRDAQRATAQAATAGESVGPAALDAMGGMGELYHEQQVAARTRAAQLERMGGMAELYAEQAVAGH
jgi:hypothetical protein